MLYLVGIIVTNRYIIIKPDFKLTSLLNLTPSDELSHFTLQKYLKPHFIETIPKELSIASDELEDEIYEWENRNGKNFLILFKLSY